MIKNRVIDFREGGEGAEVRTGVELWLIEVALRNKVSV